jgi:hypothetical protein
MFTVSWVVVSTCKGGGSTLDLSGGLARSE